jgi:hypothetical protein
MELYKIIKKVHHKNIAIDEYGNEMVVSGYAYYTLMPDCKGFTIKRNAPCALLTKAAANKVIKSLKSEYTIDGTLEKILVGCYE